MRKLFSISSNQAPVLITLFTVILLGVIYLFEYIPQNEKELKEQRFRSLQRVDDNVHAKINNSIALMDGLLKASFDPRIKSSKVQEYIKNYDTTNFTLFPVTVAPDTTIKKLAQKKKITPIFSDAEDGTSAIRVIDARRQFKLFYAKRFPDKGGDSCYYMSMLYNFDDFIKPLLPANVFDEYVVFSKGNVVYESFPSGLSYTQKDSLLGVRNSVAGSAIRNQTISGVDYKMFLQPVGFDSTNEWIIGGLLSEDKYNNEKKQLPANLVIFLIIAALIIVISLPWIKLYQMGSRDRLTLLDGGLSFFVAMLLISMLFFTALWANTQFCKTETIASEKNLANNIQTAFQSEVTGAYQELKAFDSLMDTTNLRTSIKSLGKNNLAAGNMYGDKRYSRPYPKNVKQVPALLNKDININHAFWMNSKGDDIYYWTKDSSYPPPGNFSKRNYFKNITENNPLLLDGDPVKPFYIEQLVSWTSGTFVTAISILSKMKDKQDNAPVVAVLSVNIKSLDSTIMPAGCQFAITDDKGNVLYHFYKEHNLNENLIDEFSEKTELRAAYQAHSEANFTTGYYSKQFDVYVTPVKGLPYFLLVLSDKTYIDTRDVQTFSVTLSLMFIFFLFQLIEIITIVMVIVFSRNSSLKNWSLAASWLWPKKSAHNEYVISIFYNIIIIALQTYFFTRASFAENCFMLLTGISLLTICFNALFAKRYRREDKLIYYHNKIKIIICMSLFIVTLNVFACYILNNFFGNFLLFQIGAIVVLLLFVFGRDKIIQLCKKTCPAVLQSRWNYVNSYALMAITRFIISSGIPVILFYISSFNYEQSLLARYKQVEFAKGLIQKDPHLTGTADVHAAYKDGTWIKSDSIIPIAAGSPSYSGEELKTVALLNLFRFYNNDISANTQYLNEVNATDSTYIFGSFFNHSHEKQKEVSTFARISKSGEYLNIRSAPLFYGAAKDLLKNNRYNHGLIL